MAEQAKTSTQAGPNLQALGFKTPMEVIDLLAMLKIDGQPVVNDDKAALNPQLKAELVIRYFASRFKVKPNVIPYLASVIKRELKSGRIHWGDNR